ncbi:hypothetical protein H4R35_002965 [Dimargaris xerosporica]|nr:hypothetical protein H4R35_002965 [Dimargaris xerosporica]
MKFNKTLGAQATELPVNWRQYLIQYKLLKKHIKAIVQELDETFLAAETSSPNSELLSEPAPYQPLPAPFLAAAPPQYGSTCRSAARPDSNDVTPAAQSGPLAPPARTATPHRRWSCPELVCSWHSFPPTKPKRSVDWPCPKQAKVWSLDDEFNVPPGPRSPNHDLPFTVSSRPQSWSVASGERVPGPPPAQSPPRFVYQLRGDSNTVTPTLFIPTGSENQSTRHAHPGHHGVSWFQKGIPATISNPEALALPSSVTRPLHSLAAPPGSVESSDRDNVQVEPPSPGPEPIPAGKEVVLHTDAAFFTLIVDQLNRMDEFQAENEAYFRRRLATLSARLGAVSSPYKQDMYPWRRLFQWYQDAHIWRFSDRDQHYRETQAEGSVRRSRQQFEQFAERATHPEVLAQFRLPESRAVLIEFINLNMELLSVKSFRDLNRTALTKILKKHDKRTHLAASRKFPQLVAQSKLLFSMDLPKALSYALGEQLLMIVPQPDDYQCPLCLHLIWKPIRLQCNHIFCARCLIKAFNQRIYDCPLCRRQSAVLHASGANLDRPLLNLLQLYFPREVRKRRLASERELAHSAICAVLAPHMIPAFVHTELEAAEEEDSDGDGMNGAR